MATAGRGKDFVDPWRPTPTGDYWEDAEAELDWLEEAPNRVRTIMKKVGNDPPHVVKKMVNTDPLTEMVRASKAVVSRGLGPPPVDDSRDAAAANSKHSTRGQQMQ